MNNPLPVCLTVLSVSCAVSAALGQDDETTAAPETLTEVTLGDPAPGFDPLRPNERVEPVEPLPEGQVDRILGVPPSRVLIDPRVLGVAPGEDLPDLMREGAFIVQRHGRLLPTDERGYAVIVLDPAADEAEPAQADSSQEAEPLAMVVAPNRLLESMEDLVKRRGDDLRFTVSGQVHTYRGVNYLILTDQPRPWLARPETDEPDQPEPAPVEEPAVEPTDEEEPRTEPLSPEEELEALIRQHNQSSPGGGSATNPRGQGSPDIEMPAIEDGGLSSPAVLGSAPQASRQRGAKLKEEGAFVLGRAGRLIRTPDGAHALFVFDADDVDAPEPPMLIQACKLLEEMEATVYDQGDQTPFILTGQVQVYRGANYILPTSFRLEFDRRNLE